MGTFDKSRASSIRNTFAVGIFSPYLIFKLFRLSNCVLHIEMIRKLCGLCEFTNIMSNKKGSIIFYTDVYKETDETFWTWSFAFCIVNVIVYNLIIQYRSIKFLLYFVNSNICAENRLITWTEPFKFVSWYITIFNMFLQSL